MKLFEIIQSTPDEIYAKIGSGPFLYYGVHGEIKIDYSLDRILESFFRGGKIIHDTDIYAYGFRSGPEDTHDYINPDDLRERFQRMEEQDTYEYIGVEEKNGISYFAPAYCGFDDLLYYDNQGVDFIVNCKPVKVAIQKEYERRANQGGSHK